MFTSTLPDQVISFEREKRRRGTKQGRKHVECGFVERWILSNPWHRVVETVDPDEGFDVSLFSWNSKGGYSGIREADY